MTMDSKGEHLEYKDKMGLFHFDHNPHIFSKEQMEILEKWGYWFMGLVSGDLKPFTEAQVRFIKVAKGELKANTPEEKAWFIYLGRKAALNKYGERVNVRYEAEDDTFYSSEDKKKLSRINFNTMAQNHRKGLKEK